VNLKKNYIPHKQLTYQTENIYQLTMSSVDYTLYLVTDSTPAILGGKDLTDVVTSALKGGVTIVQYRDKFSHTAELISNARRLHKVTQRFNVPLLINDRVDVALAVGCEGVHIGQDDMSKCLMKIIRIQF